MNSFADLSNHSVVVTGASSGIGRAIALEMARGGASVLVTCRQSVAQLDRVVEEIRALGSSAEPFVGDLANPATCDDLVETAWARQGPISVWINNSGADLLTGPVRHEPFGQKLQRLWEVDLRATVTLSRQAGGRMRGAGAGVILNVGWDQSEQGMAGDSGELFASIKGAIMAFTRSLAMSLAPEVRANCIAPGWIQTAWGASASAYWQRRVREETPLGRWGTPEDVAKMARFLASDEAAFITGQVISVNGGAVR